MSKKPDGLSDEEKALLARLSRPNVCVAMDQFEAALNELHVVMNVVLSRPAAVSPYASAASVQICWKDSLAELQASFEKTDERAQALIRSIKVMLALE